MQDHTPLSDIAPALAADATPTDGTMRFSVVGFDLDGTLLDTAPDITAALNHALRVAGLPVLTFDEVRPMIGGGAKRLLAKALAETHGARVPAETLDPLYEELLGYYRANIAVGTKPFPGLLESLDRLADAGIAVGVATNKLAALAEQLLDELGLAHRFACVLGGDTLGTENAKPKPDMIHELTRRCGGGPTAFVGDSIYDTEAARAAGVPSIAVSFGYRTQPIEELGADAVIDHFDALIPTLARL